MALTRREAMLAGGAASSLALMSEAFAQAPQSTEALLQDIVSLPDMELEARRAMSHMAYEFVASGAGDENTLRWNIEAFARI